MVWRFLRRQTISADCRQSSIPAYLLTVERFNVVTSALGAAGLVALALGVSACGADNGSPNPNGPSATEDANTINNSDHV